MTPSYIQHANGELVEVPELEVTGEYTLTGTHQAGITVHSGGKLLISGTQQGSVSVEGGGTLVVRGTLQGSLHVYEGGEAIVNGRQQGSTHVDFGGSVAILAGGQCQGSIHNSGSFSNQGTRGGSTTGDPIDDRPGSSVKQPNVDGIYVWRD